jgi:hypothetical protein
MAMGPKLVRAASILVVLAAVAIPVLTGTVAVVLGIAVAANIAAALTAPWLRILRSHAPVTAGTGPREWGGFPSDW